MTALDRILFFMLYKRLLENVENNYQPSLGACAVAGPAIPSILAFPLRGPTPLCCQTSSGPWSATLVNVVKLSISVKTVQAQSQQRQKPKANLTIQCNASPCEN